MIEPHLSKFTTFGKYHGSMVQVVAWSAGFIKGGAVSNQQLLRTIERPALLSFCGRPVSGSCLLHDFAVTFFIEGRAAGRELPKVILL